MRLQPFATEADVEEALRLFHVSTLDAAMSGNLSGEEEMFCAGGRRDMQDLAAQGRERQAPLPGPGCQGQVLDLLPEQRQSNACGTKGPLWLWGCSSQGGQWQITLRVSCAAQGRAGLASCGPLWCWTWFPNRINLLNIFLYGNEDNVGSSMEQRVLRKLQQSGPRSVVWLEFHSLLQWSCSWVP